jgi:cytoskeletal protein CcmA (bactofilin family)
MKLVGDVSGEEDFVIFGTVEGEVHVDGAIVVEESGVIHGNVHGRTVTVRGVVVGDAKAGAAIRVDEGGKMVGDVRAPRVNIVKGARFRGHVYMTGPEGQPVVDTEKRRRRRKRRGGTPEVESPRAMAEAQRTKRAIQPTLPGTVRAVQKADTVVGAPTPTGRRPPPPRMPILRRSRARRKDAPA